MSNRFGRDTPRASNSLFSTYDRSTSPSKSKKGRTSPRPLSHNSGYGYGYAAPSTSTPSNPYASQPYADHSNLSPNPGPAFTAYPGAPNDDDARYAGFSSGGANAGSGSASFRTATPNSRGQYSSAVLDELESQNDEHVGMLTSKVQDLKNLTSLIGAEIRDSSALADKMNDQFENSRLKLRGTMNRMLRMAEKTGVGWRVWLGFFAFVILLFWYVWLF